MKFRGLDSNGDWLLGQGLGSYAKDQDALALDIAARIRSRAGGCFFAPDDGIDYTNLLEKGRRKDFELAMGNCIMQTPGVVKINSMSFRLDPRTRAESMTYEIQTVFTRSYQATLDNITGAQS
ncbi:MAG: hypothetical protein V4510_10030 [bacterium]